MNNIILKKAINFPKENSRTKNKDIALHVMESMEMIPMWKKEKNKTNKKINNKYPNQGKVLYILDSVWCCALQIQMKISFLCFHMFSQVFDAKGKKNEAKRAFLAYPPASLASSGVYWNQAQKNFTHLYTEYPWVSVTL